MQFKPDIMRRNFTLWAVMVGCLPTLFAAQSEKPPFNVRVWDSMKPLDSMQNSRDSWQLVPVDLLALESNPSAARSDPSYYGRPYNFKGDAVVENAELTVAFVAYQGAVIIRPKTDPANQVKLVPLQFKDTSVRITECSLIQNTGDDAALMVSFSAEGRTRDCRAIFSLGPNGSVGIKPVDQMTGVRVLANMEYAIVPSFVGDDLVLDPAQHPALSGLCIPSDNLFLGLLKGQESVLVTTWPRGRQTAALSLDRTSRSQGLFKSFDLETDGRSLYVGLLTAPGLWHKEELKRTYLERDITVDWHRPFQAKWKTQLLENKTKTTFAFRESKQKIWRGAVGSYTYPVWFDQEAAVYRLSKKIPPKGHSIVYFVERQGTPLSVRAPVDIMRDALGRDMADDILDVPGRQLRTHHRRGAQGIRRACTCGCTEAIEAVFKAGQQKARQKYVDQAVEDMLYFVTRHVERIEEYQAFAGDVIAFLERSDHAAGDSKAFVDSMLEITKELQTEYSRAQANMKTLAYAGQLAEKTRALTQGKGPDNLKACLELGKQWRAMGGAQDDVLAQSHRIVRKLFQEAGTQGVATARTAEIGSQIREMCRQCLQNPDGYEIWPNY